LNLLFIPVLYVLLKRVQERVIPRKSKSLPADI
jgi:hypothetical protein